MAFEKIKFAMKTWKDAVSGGTPISAAELNRIEKGISDCAKQTNELGDSVSQLPFRGELMTGGDDSVVAWRARPSGVYWYQPTTSSNGFVLHMRRESLISEMIGYGQVCQLFVNVTTGTVAARSVDWKATTFSNWK